MDQDGKGGYANLSQLHQHVKSISKERLVMFRNIDDCEIKGIRMYERHLSQNSKNNNDYLSPQEKEWTKYMLQLNQKLEKLESNFYIPDEQFKANVNEGVHSIQIFTNKFKNQEFSEVKKCDKNVKNSQSFYGKTLKEFKNQYSSERINYELQADKEDEKRNRFIQKNNFQPNREVNYLEKNKKWIKNKNGFQKNKLNQEQTFSLDPWCSNNEKKGSKDKQQKQIFSKQNEENLGLSKRKKEINFKKIASPSNKRKISFTDQQNDIQPQQKRIKLSQSKEKSDRNEKKCKVAVQENFDPFQKEKLLIKSGEKSNKELNFFQNHQQTNEELQNFNDSLSKREISQILKENEFKIQEKDMNNCSQSTVQFSQISVQNQEPQGLSGIQEESSVCIQNIQNNDIFESEIDQGLQI